LRIIAGAFRGRRLEVPPTSRIRPTSDRVREAWFSVLQPELTNASVLDLFAGSGALGLEALSRGAARAEFVERAQACLGTLRDNVRLLGVVDRVQIHRSDAVRFAQQLGQDAFDIALADPPYATDHAASLIAIFRETAFARILCVEHRSSVSLSGDRTYTYGDVSVTFCLAR
jgi:16S rRNA (guanine966-N2)-methyltransferase